MDRLQLKHCLEAACVPEDRYLLVGVDPPRTVREGACIVRPNQRNWEVLTWEPVRLRPCLTFLTEEQACEYVLDVLTGAGAGVRTDVTARDVGGAGGVPVPAPDVVTSLASSTPERLSI